MVDRAASPDSTSSTLSCITVAERTDTAARSSVGASSANSTPPTSQGDTASITSDATKADAPVMMQQDKAEPEQETEHEDTKSEPGNAEQYEEQPDELGEQPEDGVHVDEDRGEKQQMEEEQEETSRRSSRRSRTSITTYNVQILAGTAIHTPTKYLEKHTANVMRTDRAVSGSTPVGGSDQLLSGGIKRPTLENNDSAPGNQLSKELEERISRRNPTGMGLLRAATRNAMVSASSSLGKRGREIMESGKGRLKTSRNGTDSSRRRQSDSAILMGKPTKRVRLSTTSIEELDEEPGKEYVKPKTKRWLSQGLYVGQHRDFDARLTESQNKARRKAAAAKENKILPMPMFAGERLLSMPYKEARDFKLPFDIYSPLPRKAKPEDWKKTSKNLFVGDAATIWKKSKPEADSYCLCDVEDGCGENCQNRFMLYECDKTNCLIGPEFCTNRAFAELKIRAKGNGYDYGVEVVETEDRGYGVRAMRCFNPHQIIVEYAGEIITQEECDRRMKVEYKNNECYYLMTFHNKMIIDATRGSIARFVNHSCEPNCRMIKWTVAGEPRMALFAGDWGIMTGEELTYDYNFDPFSAKNVQECRCGTASCRGVLGPRSKDQPKARSTATSLVAGAKRKIQEVFRSKGSRGGSSSPHKRRKVADIARSALSQAKKTVTESQSAKDARSVKEAADAEARSASRAERALRRSSTTNLASKRPKTLHKRSSNRTTSFSISRKIAPRPGGVLRRPNSKLSRFTSSVKKHSASIKSANRRPILPPLTTRSVAKAAGKAPSAASQATSAPLRQTTLPFKPLSVDLPSSPFASTSDNDGDNDDNGGTLREFAALPLRATRRPTTASSVRSAAASMKKNVVRSVRGPRRAAAVARMGLGLGVNGIGGLGEGGSGNTIRVILGSDE
ncbi:hypothetical protein K432DRAFT_309292 [Lepidopterella palustris CBS 459.81]|uniref:SET domain-containing protein n=1 Tax=Lepidopterella palustris CBS 459.81 TaxID=1314670 RepID=A0A8E2E0F1_9PEZI|nr:hypothetical protein K432DRAFT_309292 [Lepidopterella palustris CBS 459.81]